ncbi:DUF4392 domain-containing protein [Halonotius pteroides]|nr:DUF4392 domain-containing protein [Halonotius pteroides]
MFAALDDFLRFDPGERGVGALHAAANPNTPPVEAAAQTLREVATDGDAVLLTTGFPIPPDWQPETDGPPGTVVLARALQELGAKLVIVAEPRVEAPIDAAAEVCELATLPFESVSPDVTTTATSEALLDRYEPGAVIAIERPGRTADHTYRSMTGTDITAHVAPMDPLFALACDREIPTIAVGDGGNEIGMGGIRSVVEAEIKHGEQIAATTAVDHLVVAGVSNWGAYGIVAALEHLIGQARLHHPSTERELLAACCAAGCVDGRTGVAEPWVDGLSTAMHEYVVGLFRELLGHERTETES